jgi:tight adherence protein B
MSVIWSNIQGPELVLAAAGPYRLFLFWGGVAAILIAGVYLFIKVRSVAIEQASNRRLEVAMQGSEPEMVRPPSAKPFMRSYWYVPWLAAAAIVVTFYLTTTLSWLFLVIIFITSAMLFVQLEAYWADRQRFLIEQQLASAIDLMVGSLQAGAGVLNSMDDAAKEAPRALRHQLEEVVGRIRFGDEPQSVFQDLMVRVPLETFRLFATALAVHWKVGGSLAPTLASVGRTIRNRIEITRRTRSMTTQARVSILMVLALTYFIAWMMYSVDHERMERFIHSPVGPPLILASIVLQVIGIVWCMSLSRPKF